MTNMLLTMNESRLQKREKIQHLIPTNEKNIIYIKGNTQVIEN